MKKLFVILAVAAVTLVACKKEEVKYTESLGEISFKAVNGMMTKGAEVAGTAFDADFVMKVVATAKEKANYFGGTTGLDFVQESAGVWHANPAVYWPAGQQRVDFLAWATKPKTPDFGTGVAPAFDATRPADKLTVADWNVYDKQVDFLYAAANNKFKTDAVDPVAMTFAHSTAMLIFNYQVSAGPDIKIISIDFDDFVKEGTLTVDNTKNVLEAKWAATAEGTAVQFPANATAAAKSTYNTMTNAGLAAEPATNFIKYADSKKAAPSGWFQLGDTRLIIPQERQNFTITYQIGNDDATNYHFYANIGKGEWEAGYIYFYNIDFNLREIKIAPAITDWQIGGAETL